MHKSSLHYIFRQYTFNNVVLQVAQLIREVRSELDQLLQDKIENPHMDLCSCPRGNKIISTIVRLISTQ